MTVLSLLGGTWEYQFEDETTTTTTSTQAGTRMIRYISGGVITVNALYSAIADAVDDFQAMGFKNPMLPVTPNEYTLQNQAFISRKSTEFLKEGTISADWSLIGATGDTSGHGVIRVPYTGGTNFVTGDIGRRVTDGTDFGTLLDFEIEPDGTLIAWVRPENATPTTGDIFDGTGSLTVVADGGTGASTSHTAVAVEGGVSTYTAIQAIGSIPTATEVYIVQDRIKLKDATSDSFQFWSTDSAVSLGIISVLIRTEVDGSKIADEDLEVFARKYGSLYDNFRLNVAAGGLSALPLASAADINNTTGYRRNVMTGSSGTWTVGNALYVGGTFATATMKGVITAESAGTIEYYLIGDLTDLTGSESIKEYDFVTASDGDATATGAAGGSIANLLGPTDTASGEGGNVTITMGTTTRDHDNTGVAEPYSIIINCQSNIPIAKVYERIKYDTRRGSDETFWVTTTNMPGEQYRGLEKTIYYIGPTGTLVNGELITNESRTLQKMYLISQNTGATGESVGQTYVTVSDIQTSLEVSQIVDTDVIADAGSTDDIQVDTGGAGGSIVTHAAIKASPFGSFTGSQIFGAPGIDFRNPHGDDTQAYILTDDLGTLRTPPNTISYTVANTRLGDRILVARDTGTSGVIDKDQFGGCTATTEGAATIVVGGTIDSEVPPAGYIRIVENTKQEEHKYWYSSRVTGASGSFTFQDISTGDLTADATTSTILLVDASADYVTDVVKAGMLINTSATEYYEVVSVTDLNTLVIKQVFGTGGTFTTGQTYTINTPIQAYAITDDIFDLIVDEEELAGTSGSPGTIQNTFVYSGTPFGTVAQVRLGKTILPFEQNQTVSGNTSVTTVRTADTIAV